MWFSQGSCWCHRFPLSQVLCGCSGTAHLTSACSPPWSHSRMDSSRMQTPSSICTFLVILYQPRQVKCIVLQVCIIWYSLHKHKHEEERLGRGWMATVHVVLV